MCAYIKTAVLRLRLYRSISAVGISSTQISSRIIKKIHFVFPKMVKFALVLLLGLVAISNQQFYQQPASERLLWLLSYYPPQAAFNTYNYQHDHNHDMGDGRASTFPNSLSHSLTIPTYSQDKQPYSNAIENANNMDEDQFPDVQSRGKFGVSRYRPWFLQHQTPQYNPRIVINLASRTNLLNKVKTVTFTFTSSVTFTSVQSCIPSTEFSPGSAGVTCRKRRGVLESSHSKLETSQFAIAPSDVQRVEQTVLTSQDPTAGNGPLANDAAANHGVVSSKDEDTLDELSNVVTLKPVGYLRDKRFFFHLVTTTTAISYTFLSTTVTKTVNLLSPMPAPIGQLVCLPQGYAVCPYLGTLLPR
ncbi:uncharacterized protein LOC116920955 [Daphnia magna]|uniref:uncharacterized protein LOC116920955 n=1 Tax=Daphnia magna TaxID=35525 RepID=UPI001403BD67|nr:uncharacterized protein LOC116920955 [Daphnia magna]